MGVPVPELQTAILGAAHDPIIVIDAAGIIQEFNPAADDRSRAVLAGFQSHLPKPIDPHELTALVATLVVRKIAPRIS